MWQIRDNAITKDFIDFVNVHAEHCHFLVSLGVDQIIQKMKKIFHPDPPAKAGGNSPEVIHLREIINSILGL